MGNRKSQKINNLKVSTFDFHLYLENALTIRLISVQEKYTPCNPLYV